MRVEADLVCVTNMEKVMAHVNDDHMSWRRHVYLESVPLIRGNDHLVMGEMNS